jgi:alcohol dehydrogenase, propanol-preferring
MRALQMVKWRSDPELVDVAEPKPGPGQVVVKVGGAGACHSDIHILYETPGEGDTPWRLPFTLGHETAGWVHAVGAGVTDLDVGQAVAVYGAWGCGICARCRAGIENYCERPVPQGGLGIDGGMAEFLLVPDSRHLVPLPDGVEPALAAPLTDAGLTPYHAIRRSWAKLGPTATAVVVGVGGLGHMAVQILKATTAARVVAVDSKPEALELARSLGADQVVSPGETAATDIKGLTRGLGADVVLDFVGSDETMRLSLTATRPLADVTIVGIAGGSYPLGFFSMPYEVSVQTVYWGSRSELVELLDLAARGLVRPEVTTFSLEKAPDAYRALHEGTLSGRAVVVPHAAP